MQNLLALNELALKFLNREEYADFLTVMSKIRDRIRESPLNEILQQNNTIEDNKKYSHDIEINLETKVYRNNHKGERIELEQYKEIPFLIKIPIGEDITTRLNDICKFIDNPW